MKTEKEIKDKLEQLKKIEGFYCVMSNEEQVNEKMIKLLQWILE